MSKKGIYGDNPEISALSSVYGRCVKVLTGEDFMSHDDSVYNARWSTSGMILLHYNNAHYQLLEDESQATISAEGEVKGRAERKELPLGAADIESSTVSIDLSRPGTTVMKRKRCLPAHLRDYSLHSCYF
jgi:hypothetical protein